VISATVKSIDAVAAIEVIIAATGPKHILAVAAEIGVVASCQMSINDVARIIAEYDIGDMAGIGNRLDTVAECNGITREVVVVVVPFFVVLMNVLSVTEIVAVPARLIVLPV